MGLFFNYDKPGKGIDKDAPKKKGPFLYLELFWRKLGLLTKSNMLYFLVSIPVVLVYHFFIFSMSMNLFKSLDTNTVNQFAVMMTVILAVLWGTGPVSAGYTYLLRNFAREEHAWVLSDFFEKAKENFRYGLVFLVVDIAAFLLGTNAIGFYFGLAEKSPVFLYLMFVVIICMLVYTFMHFYLYQFTVTFENRIRDVYKNALIMALANMPMNLILTAIVVVCSYFAFSMLSAVGIILVTFILWISMMRFPIDFYATRAIQKKIIDARVSKESDE